MIPDQRAREVISSTGLDRTLFVEAGAGTGKTSQLVERIVNLVADDGVPLAAIAAITFTDAAAAELRDRVRVALEKRHHTAADPLDRQRCREAIAAADQAAISTLHGFAQRVLSEHPAESGLPPRIGVLDEINSALEREERWERFVDSLHGDPANEELLVRASLLEIALEPSYEGQASLRDVAARLDDSWDRLGPAADEAHPPLGQIDFGPFDRAVADLTEFAECCTDPTDGFYVHLVGRLLPDMQALVDLPDPHAKLRAMCAAGDWKKGGSGRKAAWGGDAKAARARVDDVNAARDEVLGAVSHDVLVRLRRLIARDLIAAAGSRRVEGRLQFHDLLVLAARLLRTSPGARQALHRRYQHLLLDEFQDTDPLQIELAVLIAAGVAGEHTPAWQQAEVPDGRLFFVGDPKQSIYRFRRANIELFLEARARFGDGDARQQLTTNFRTVGPVIDWLNAVFATLMPTEQPGRQPAYEALHAHRPPSAESDHRPLLVGGPHEGMRASEVRHAEAADVTAIVASIRDTPEAWPVGGTAERDWRPARLSDVTILIPTRTELPAITAALADARLPYHLSTGTLIYETQEVRDALAVLGAVDDPSDELALVTALRSPLYGCSDRALFEFRQAGGRWDLRKAPPDDLPAHHPVVAALVHLRSLWERRWWERPSALLHRILVERRAALLGFGADRPDESWSRLRFLLDQARHFEEVDGGDLRAFIRWSDAQRSETVTVHQPVALDPADDAVSIMTIHGSKGLEFPITIVAGTSARPRKGARGASVIFDDDGLPGIAIRKGRTTSGHEELATFEAEMDECEQLRLLYVACTRARDHLVVSGHHPAGNHSFAHQITDAAANHPHLWRRPEPVAAQPEPSATEPPAPSTTAPAQLAAERDQWIERRRRLLDAQRATRHISATAVARAILAGDGAAGDELLDDGSDPDVDTAAEPGAEPSRRRGRAGTAIGRAVHATLQGADLADPSSDAIEAEAARQAHLESVPEHTATVVAMVHSALRSDIVRSARVAHRELYVAAPVGSMVLEGYIDLLVETDEGLMIVDYKTDTVRSEADVDAKLATYELQGAAYAVALEAATGLQVSGCRFVFCRPRGAIEREVADLGVAMARVRAHLAPR